MVVLFLGDVVCADAAPAGQLRNELAGAVVQMELSSTGIPLSEREAALKSQIRLLAAQLDTLSLAQLQEMKNLFNELQNMQQEFAVRQFLTVSPN